MNFKKILKDGATGTSWMTLYMYLSSYFSKHQMKVIKILGTMLTNETTSDGRLSNSKLTKVVGSIAHYAVGEFFTTCYYFLWRKNVLKPTIKTSISLGFINGLVGILGWKFLFALHPNPPKVSLKKYLLNLILAHEIFAITTTNSYKK